METLINCLCGRIVALRGTRNLDYPFDMSRFLRSVRLALHLAQTINQGFHKGAINRARPPKPRVAGVNALPLGCYALAFQAGKCTNSRGVINRAPAAN